MQDFSILQAKNLITFVLMIYTIKENIISPNTVDLLLQQKILAEGKNEFSLDQQKFHRKIYNKIPLLHKLHKTIFYKIGEKVFGQKIEPSFAFLSDYIPGKGNCPIHYDLESCYYTIIIPIKTSSPWPLYLNLKEEFLNRTSNPRIALDMDKREPLLFKKIVDSKQEVILNDRDAVFFSGHKCFHWRNTLKSDQKAMTISLHYKNRV